MKRLLAYLIVVLGLGLTFNISDSNALTNKEIKKMYGYNDDYICISKINNKYIIGNNDYVCKNDIKIIIYKKQTALFNSVTHYFLRYAKNNPDFPNDSKKCLSLGNTCKDTSWKPLTDSILTAMIGKKIAKPLLKYKSNTKIAKAEPSQTQKVSTKDLDKANEVENYIKNIEKEISSLLLVIKKKKNKSKDCKDSRGHSNKCNLIGQVETSQIKNLVIQKKEYERIYKNIKTQIAKAEPSQTQKVELDIIFCTDAGYNDVYLKETFNGKCPNSRPREISYSKFIKPNLNLCYIENQTDSLKVVASKASCKDVYGGGGVPIKYDGKVFYYFSDKPKTQIAKVEPSQTQKVVKNKNIYNFCIPLVKQEWNAIRIELTNCNDEYEKKVDLDTLVDFTLSNKMNSVGANKSLNSNYLIGYFKNNKMDTFELKESIEDWKLSNAEPTIKPKKKTKVAKVEDSTQEEFKPKKTNQDKDPPTIEVAENITVSDSAYEIKGNVKDKSKKIFIEVDGQTIPVKKGKFKLKRYSPVDEQIKIVAIDQWGNRSKPKIVNVTIDIKNIEVAEKIEPLNPTKMRSKKNKDRIALIIGIEKYDQIPSASYANLDAKFFYEYVRKGFGVSKSNIKLLIDEDADLVKSLGTLNKWLPGKIKSDQTELIIFFAGHGLASNDGKELYILPQDSDPDLLNRTALSRTELFKQIIDLNPKSVTMFMDTCYSGISRDEKMLLASARPVRIVANEEEGIPDNFTIFSASQLDQISSGIKEAKHGIFSYYLMKGLEGNADANKDKNITNGELLAYMDENVSQKASELGRQQNPSLAGDPNKVLINY